MIFTRTTTDVMHQGRLIMEFKNSHGETAQLADNLTLKEVVDMGFSIDICDDNYDPQEHWQIKQKKQQEGEY